MTHESRRKWHGITKKGREREREGERATSCGSSSINLRVEKWTNRYKQILEQNENQKVCKTPAKQQSAESRKTAELATPVVLSRQT